MSTSDGLSLIAQCRLQVLVVPVTPIRRSRYAEYAAQLRRFERIALRDVPADSRGNRAALSASSTSNGHVLLSFVESYQRGHAYLEDVQLHRRLFGIVGVADASEWTELDEVQADFERICAQLPPVPAVRCIAFGSEQKTAPTRAGLVVPVAAANNLDAALTPIVAELVASMLRELSDLVRKLAAGAA